MKTPPRTTDAFWLILLSYLVALVINALPLPHPWGLLLPPVGLLVLFYWALRQLDRTHFVAAVLIGLLYDALEGTLLGGHALLFSVLLFIVLRLRLRLRLAHPLQQSLLFTGLLYLFEALGWFILRPNLDEATRIYWLAMPLTALLIWPVISATLHFLTRPAGAR
ncbi:rod shape-determining protein MreD [Sulfurivirga caldicuralii]|uniref:Rod shape-determining protein MreD n=1 Tax=Sulfurivirga caldicuralii TaxID=364032 RepID=A0A1N6EKB2_9GAMM|nr:rod shape-determining protein MreD [Sulfurivirga caldicuralii]SIN83519.1 rod shape-determining protein MreD [Sulfurivirga caldicuralii]